MAAQTTLNACPSAETVRQYLLGSFDESRAGELEQHLEYCPMCEEVVASLGEVQDSVLRHLPLAAGAASAAPPWLERMKELPYRQTAADSPLPEQPSELNELGSYELTGVLGKGGMGVVYRGRHKQLGREVAIKVVNPKLVSAAEARGRFEREIQILGGLRHPGIVMATDAGKVGPASYLVMELIEGADLSRIVRTQGPLTVGEACEVARQIAVALAAAHRAGAVHRDVKPSNVMIDTQGQVKLLDFGLGLFVNRGPDGHTTNAGQLLGTLHYMAPEQASGGQVQPAADLYGLGATLFFLLTGQAPKAEAASNSARPLSRLRADIPEQLDGLVASLLAHDPADRPADASVVASRLATFAQRGTPLAGLIPADSLSLSTGYVSRTLAELLNSAQDLSANTPSQKATVLAKHSIPRVAWIVGLAGALLIGCLGLVLLLKTSEGTLRIESEVGGITIEVVDEKEQSSQLEIEQGGEETRLKAGKYRVRIAGGHDSLQIEPQTVVLERGGKKIVRIIREPPTKAAASSTKSGEGAVENASPAFPSVQVTIVSVSGTPMAGAKVEMSLKNKADQPIRVSDESGKDGVSLDRVLPYGLYDLYVTTASGWYSRAEVLVEFGKDFKRTVVAPNPDEMATVQLKADISDRHLDGLRFGNWQEPQGFGFWSKESPEPGAPPGDFETFPTTADGIEEVALGLSFRIMQPIPQSGNTVLDWSWRPDAAGDTRRYLLRDSRIYPIEKTDGKAKDRRTGTAYFSKGYGPELLRVGYVEFDLGEPVSLPRVLEVPAGRVLFYVSGIYGRPSAKVLESMGVDEEEVKQTEGARPKIWLAAEVQNNSAWTGRLLEGKQWIPNLGDDGDESKKWNLAHVARQEHTLKTGETWQVQISSPAEVP